MTENFDDFINRFKEKVSQLFHVDYNIDQLNLNRGLPKEVWDGIMNLKPLSVAIPKEFGGRGGVVEECLGILSAASYESLALSLTFGINIALFLEPMAKYGPEELKAPIFDRFLEQNAMGGLMITEPEYGSDALNMKTAYTQDEGGYHIKGNKHWQGLTGMADFWLVAARKQLENGDLVRDIDFFITDEAQPEQKIMVDHLFDNLGLYIIPYGLNKIDITVPPNQKLEQESTGIKMMLDILHRSRFQFPGMGMGFIHRMMDESLTYTKNRIVGGQPLNVLDSVKYQLSRIQAAYTLTSGMCAHSSRTSGIEFDLATEGLQANSMKALVTDLMQESAQITTQLHGSAGYKLNHISGRGIIDSRPFQIFEGSNEMLYTQISEILLKQMRRGKVSNLSAYLNQYQWTRKVADRFAKDLDFEITGNLAQRQHVELGKAVARLVCLQYVDDMVDRGFRKDLFENTAKHVAMDIKMLMSDVKDYNDADSIIEYRENSHWADFLV